MFEYWRHRSDSYFVLLTTSVVVTTITLTMRHELIRRGFYLIQSSSQSQSQSHIATDGQSVSKSWCRAPSGAYNQIFITV
jgi:hypothetical protein